MNSMLLSPSRTASILLLFLLIISTGCSSDQSKSSKSKFQEKSMIEFTDSEDKLDIAKKVFYSLPSPVESAIILKNAGAIYDQELLNPVSNALNYNTNMKMALNLGIYSTDLSYASLFEQSQTILDYVNVTKRMADGLAILDAIDENTIRRLEENINNKELIIEIISETLLNSNSFLEDKGLQSIASLILVGGWIEGLYLAVNLVEPDSDIKGNQLVDRIAEQKITMDIVVNLLQDYMDNINTHIIMKDMQELKEIYDKVRISAVKNKPAIDPETNVTLLKSEASIKMSTDVFKELAGKIKELRSRYIA